VFSGLVLMSIIILYLLEQNLLSHASRGNASSVKLELEPTKHSGIFSY